MKKNSRNAGESIMEKNPKDLSNIEKVVRSLIADIKLQQLAETFNYLYDNRNTRKFNLRIDGDVLEYFQNLGQNYNTYMRLALKAFVQAHQTGKIKLPKP